MAESPRLLVPLRITSINKMIYRRQQIYNHGDYIQTIVRCYMIFYTHSEFYQVGQGKVKVENLFRRILVLRMEIIILAD
jgi:hypothetical protein